MEVMSSLMVGQGARRLHRTELVRVCLGSRLLGAGRWGVVGVNFYGSTEVVKPNWDRIPSSNLCSPLTLNVHCMFFSFSEHLSLQLASFLNIWPMNPLAQMFDPFGIL